MFFTGDRIYFQTGSAHTPTGTGVVTRALRDDSGTRYLVQLDYMILGDEHLWAFPRSLISEADYYNQLYDLMEVE